MITDLHKDSHRQNVAMARYWWNRYRRMPRWRKRAKIRALQEAHYWGERAIKRQTTAK